MLSTLDEIKCINTNKSSNYYIAIVTAEGHNYLSSLEVCLWHKSHIVIHDTHIDMCCSSYISGAWGSASMTVGSFEDDVNDDLGHHYPTWRGAHFLHLLLSHYFNFSYYCARTLVSAPASCSSDVDRGTIEKRSASCANQVVSEGCNTSRVHFHMIQQWGRHIHIEIMHLTCLNVDFEEWP